MASLKRLWRNWRRQRRSATEGLVPLPSRAIRNADVIITTNEVTDRHGTGVILNRIFGAAANVLSIRSSNLYREHSLGAEQLCFCQEGLSRAHSFERVLHM